MLFYCDPPYWETEGYDVPFTFDQYQEMAYLIGRLKGKVIISLNDHLAIRDCFKDYAIESTGIRYTVGRGQGKEASEILIFNWDTQKDPPGLF